MVVVNNFRTDENGNPAGGETEGVGIYIQWQNSVGVKNGAFVEEIIEIAAERLRFYNNSKFNCIENTRAITYLENALAVLQERTARRKAEGTEGTHNV